MATYIGGPLLDPLGAAIGQGFGQGLGAIMENRVYNKDYQNWTNFAQGLTDKVKFDATVQAAHNWRDQPDDFNQLPPNLTPGGPPIGRTPMPAPPPITSARFRPIAEQFMANQLQNMMGLNPLQEAQRENYLAEAALKRAQAFGTLSPTRSGSDTDIVSKLKDGEYHNVLIDKVTGDEIEDLGPVQPKEWEPDVFEDTETGSQEWVSPGKKIPPGLARVKDAQSIVNIGTGDKITQTTRTRIEDQIVMDSNFAQSLAGLRDNFHPQFLELGPTVKGWFYNQASRVEDLRKMYPEQSQEFYTQMAAWKQMSDQVFNEYRKVITGAQAGMPEIMFLKRSVPTKEDSPTVWQAKSEVTEAFFRERAKRYSDALSSDNPLDVLTQTKLDQQAGKAVADRVKGGEFGDEVIEALGVKKTSAPKPTNEMTTAEKVSFLRSQGVPMDKIVTTVEQDKQIGAANPGASWRKKYDGREPTGEELRYENTREAYEYGKKLGYWQ